MYIVLDLFRYFIYFSLTQYSPEIFKMNRHHLPLIFWTRRTFWCERDLIANNLKQAAPIERMTVTELNKGSQHIHLAILRSKMTFPYLTKRSLFLLEKISNEYLYDPYP